MQQNGNFFSLVITPGMKHKIAIVILQHTAKILHNFWFETEQLEPIWSDKTAIHSTTKEQFDLSLKGIF